MGGVESMTMAAFAPKEFDAAGEARVKTALLPLALLIVPPFRVSESIPT